MKRRWLWWVLFGLAVVLAWQVTGDDDAVNRDRIAEAADETGDARRSGGGFSHGARSGAGRDMVIDRDGIVAITGRVVESLSNEPVGDVEVVFRSELGEETTMAAEDGTYRVVLPVGTYRAFVRDDNVLSFGPVERVRLPELPSADRAGVPVESLMPLVIAKHDLDNVDLSVTRAGVVTGRVVDAAGRPIPRAVVRATGGSIKPSLGTDTAETDQTGTFELRLPEGDVELEATHPRHAGPTEKPHVIVSSDEPIDITIQLTAGCMIAGRVIGADGKPAGEGAIERELDEERFVADAKINTDGTFRWVTTTEEQVKLRAWPWKAPPSQPQTFACREGARFDVVFQLPPTGPDLTGLLVDASGAAVPFAYIDLAPLDEGGIPQQERSDADGNWAVFAMPAGRYQVTAFAPGRGFVSQEIAIPQQGVRLALGGLGRIEGSAPLIANGSMEVELESCAHGDEGRVELEGDRRLVAVIDSKFVIENVPSCQLMLAVHWQSSMDWFEVTVPANGRGTLEVDIGPARRVTVSGTVTDADGRPAPDVTIHSSHHEESSETTTDASGRYVIQSFAGARINAGLLRQLAVAEVPVTAQSTATIDLELSQPEIEHDYEHLPHDPGEEPELEPESLDGEVEEHPAGDE